MHKLHLLSKVSPKSTVELVFYWFGLELRTVDRLGCQRRHTELYITIKMCIYSIVRRSGFVHS